MRGDPLFWLSAVMAGVMGMALGVTGEVSVLAHAIPAAAVYSMIRPATAPRGRVFDVVFQVLVPIVFFVLYALSFGSGNVLGGAVGLTIPVQVHSLLCQPTHRTIRRLHVVSFFQLVALAASTTKVLFGPLLVVQMLLLPLALTLGALERAQGLPRRPVWWSRGMLLPVASVAALSLLGAALVFLALPRYEYGMFQSYSRPSQRLSGFSDRVRLGDITRIQSSDKVVMRARFEGIRPSDVRWRGKAFDLFSGNEWSVSAESKIVAPRGSDVVLRPIEASSRRVVQDLALEPIQERALFHLADPAVIRPANFNTVMRDDWGNVERGGGAARRLRYRVVSVAGGLVEPLGDAARASFLQLPELDPGVARLASELGGEGSDAVRSRRIEQALQVRWEYTLDVNDVGVERPVERFLLERAPGHCEYFATGMVVLLRELGIPARLVTGFQEGSYSRLFSSWVVRQRDAHAWVEAWLPETGWTAFDPTPLAGREVADGSDTIEAWRRIEMLWDDNVIGFNYTFQVGFLISVRDFAVDAFASARRRGWPLVALPVVLVASAALLVAHRRRKAARARRAGVAFYAEAQRLLERRGYVRERGQTPLELARVASSDAEAGEAGRALLELTELYYAARFGGRHAEPRHVEALLAQLEALPARA